MLVDKTETMKKFEQSNAYLEEIIREAQGLSEPKAKGMGRRGFLKLSAAGGAGLVLAFHLPGSKALAADANVSDVLNAFVRIAPSGVVTGGSVRY